MAGERLEVGVPDGEDPRVLALAAGVPGDRVQGAQRWTMTGCAAAHVPRSDGMT